MERQAKDWDKVFASHVSVKVFYLGLLQLNNKRKTFN